MTERDLGPDPEENSEVEEVIFEEIEGHGDRSSRTAPLEAPFQPGQILGGRFEVIANLRRTPTSQFVQARDRVRGGADIVLEVVQRSVLSKIGDLPERIRVIVPRLKELSHEVIDPLLDFGMLPDGRVYFASQLLLGTSLADRLAEGQASDPREALAVTRRILNGLEYGLSIGQLHGGLDPHSLFFEEGDGDLAQSLRLLSFGRRSILAGPDDAPSESRDVRAVGPLLAQMMVGQPIKGELDVWWDERAPSLSKEAARFVGTALGTVRGAGFENLSELRQALEALPELRPRAERSPTWGWVGLAFAAGLLGSVGTWTYLKSSNKPNEVLAGSGDSELVAGTETTTEVQSGDFPLDGQTPSLATGPEEIESLRNGLGLTNRALVDLRASTQGYEAQLKELQARLEALGSQADSESGLTPPERARVTEELSAKIQSLQTALASLEGRLELMERERAASEEGPAVVAQLPLPESAGPALRETAQELFSGQASPFGPVGSRALHHTLTAEGDEGWMIITVGRDAQTPADADQSWLLEEEYLSASGQPLGSRQVQVVRRGGRFEEIDGRVYPLLDLENPWVELSTLDFEPRSGLTPPASLAVPEGALEAFQERLEADSLVALVEVDGMRRSWFVPGLGFVRFEDPNRLRRELVLMEAH